MVERIEGTGREREKESASVKKKSDQREPLEEPGNKKTREPKRGKHCRTEKDKKRRICQEAYKRKKETGRKKKACFTISHKRKKKKGGDVLQDNQRT